MAWLACFSSEGNPSETCCRVDVGSRVNIQRTLFACSLCLRRTHVSGVTPSLLPVCLAPAAVKGTHHIHIYCVSDGWVPTSSHFHKQMSENWDIPSSPGGCSINSHSFCPFFYPPYPPYSCRAHRATHERCACNAVTVWLHRGWVWRVTRRLCRWSGRRNTWWPALLRAWRSVRRPRSLLRLRYPQLSAKANVQSENLKWKFVCLFVYLFIYLFYIYIF